VGDHDLDDSLAEFTTEVAATLTRLAERRYTADQAAHTVGVGTLLVAPTTVKESSCSSTSP
jgi:hypothetical protein